jgi:tyrosinase
MLVSTLLWTLSATVSTVSATFAITGTHTNTSTTSSQRPFRHEINSFVNVGPAFDLYIQALLEFQQTNQNQLLSYFQVAGIHGYPANNPWDGVSRTSVESSGYCTHGSVLFPTWHRPYLALFEQILSGNAIAIANSYPASNRAMYQAAAQNFRMPYWDWSTIYTLPPVMNSPYILINTRTGSTVLVNPLFQYTFPSGSASRFPNDIISKVKTVRTPDSNGNSQPDVINKGLLANKQMVHDAIYPLLSSQPDYNAMSNTFYRGPNGQTYQNLENMHNYMHGMIGGYGGHMSYIVYSSFDPIFWLHHTNVDRLFAIWQALYPNSYVVQETSQSGVVQNVNTNLAPFHSNSNGAFHTSNTARNTASFGYTYPEVVDWNVSPSQLAQNVRTIVNHIYNPSSNSKRSVPVATDECGNPDYQASFGAPAGVALVGEPSVYSPAPVSVAPASPVANAASHQWVVNIVADKTKIGSSCFVHFYFNAPTGNSSSWAYDPNLIATHSVLIPPQNMTGVPTVSTGQVPLTYAVLGCTSDIGPGAFDAVVKGRLQYRAQHFDNSPIAPADLARTQAFAIEIASRTVTQNGPNDFPTYGDWQTHYTGTLGSCGYAVADA